MYIYQQTKIVEQWFYKKKQQNKAACAAKVINVANLRTVINSYCFCAFKFPVARRWPVRFVCSLDATNAERLNCVAFFLKMFLMLINLKKHNICKMCKYHKTMTTSWQYRQCFDWNLANVAEVSTNVQNVNILQNLRNI